MSSLDRLLSDVRSCTLCEPDLELGARPVLQVHKESRILIAGQAPGRTVHRTGIPFDDPSGDRLRDWMGVTREEFYDPTKIAVLPMGFCFPGSGRSGDLPPRKECAPAWRRHVLDRFTGVELTLIIGRYAMEWHFDRRNPKVTELARRWEEFWPDRIPLPHPSPRNRRWLKENPWFEDEVLPVLRKRVEGLVRG